MIECNVVCHTKCARLVPDFCGMSMEKANLMLSEMKAANNRRRTIHSDSSPFSLDSNAKPLFASSSSNTQLQQQLFNDSNIISPQPSFSTPVTPKTHNTPSRPISLIHDSTSFQSLTHVFSQNSISETLSRTGNQLVSRNMVNSCSIIKDYM